MRRIAVLAALVLSLVLGATAWAGTATYAGSWTWPAGQAYSSSFSPNWWRNVMTKNASVETTITFIDNTSYGWHATIRGTNPYLATHWLSSQVKKAHCRTNVGFNVWAGCAVTD